ncbi:MAG TPA: EamA family transporter, partial [Spirochaetia bacterium]|nr:EamA family transporter [Spirochaetia bacterium]
MSSALLALGAILLWGFLALLGSQLSGLPPLLMTGMALTIGGIIGLLKVREWKVPLTTFLVGLAGIFGYHFLLFTAFRHAPTVEANLINYLWPL